MALRPVDRLLGAYLLLTAAALAVAGGSVEHRWLLAGSHLLGAAAIRYRSRWPRLLADWYPLLGLGLLYAALGGLTRLVTSGYHDAAVAEWERALFAGQPSQTLRGAEPNRLLDEYLHFCYFAYYVVPWSLAIWLRLRNEMERFSEALTATLGSFLLCCVVFIVFPVAGPYHHFGHPAIAELPGVVPPIVHSIVQSASSVGTAFPSSHTAVAVAVWVSAWRLARPLFWVLTFVVPGLAVGTVYGGFHYAVDTLAGAAIGVIASRLARAAHRSREPSASRSQTTRG